MAFDHVAYDRELRSQLARKPAFPPYFIDVLLKMAQATLEKLKDITPQMIDEFNKAVAEDVATARAAFAKGRRVENSELPFMLSHKKTMFNNQDMPEWAFVYVRPFCEKEPENHIDHVAATFRISQNIFGVTDNDPYKKRTIEGMYRLQKIWLSVGDKAGLINDAGGKKAGHFTTVTACPSDYLESTLMFRYQDYPAIMKTLGEINQQYLTEQHPHFAPKGP